MHGTALAAAAADRIRRQPGGWTRVRVHLPADGDDPTAHAAAFAAQLASALADGDDRSNGGGRFDPESIDVVLVTRTRLCGRCAAPFEPMAPGSPACPRCGGAPLPRPAPRDLELEFVP